MDDGDGAFPVEMMAGQPAQAIQQTIYNGTAVCQGCSMLMTPVMTLFGGSLCPDCTTARGTRRIKELKGER